MRKDGVVGTSLYFSPQNKRHRDAYRILSVFPRKKTELVACFVQKFLAEKGITDVEQVSENYLRKIIKQELEETQHTGNSNNIIDLLSAILHSQSTYSQAATMVGAEVSSSSDKPKSDESTSNSSLITQDYSALDSEESVIEEIELSSDDKPDEDGDDTTGLADNWQAGLNVFKL